MVSGKRFFPLFGGVVILFTVAFIAVILTKQEQRPPPEFMDQMDQAPRCELVAGANSGVRRQSLTALLINHPEWGIEVERVQKSYGPIDPVLNLPLPGQEGVSIIEVSFPKAGDPYGTEMDGIRFLCKDDVIQGAWPIEHRVDRLVLRGKSAFQAPSRVPRAGLPQAIDLRGEGIPGTALWLSRCASTDGPESPASRCTIEAYSPEQDALLVTVQGYAGSVEEKAPVPVSLKVTPTGIEAEGEGMGVLTLDVALTLNRLTSTCLEGEDYSMSDSGQVMPAPSCVQEPTTLLGPCRCGPTALIPEGDRAGAPLTCRPGDGFEDKLGGLCSLITSDDTPGALELSQALRGGGA